MSRLPEEISNQTMTEFVHNAVVLGHFWLAGPQLANLKIELDQIEGTPDQLPSAWGSPAFLHMIPLAGDLISYLYQQISQKAHDQVAELG